MVVTFFLISSQVCQGCDTIFIIESVLIETKIRENGRGNQEGMNNSKRLATLVTQDAGGRQTKHATQKTKKKTTSNPETHFILVLQNC